MNFKNVILSLALVFAVGCGKSCSDNQEKKDDSQGPSTSTNEKAPDQKQGAPDLFSFISQDSNLFIGIDYKKIASSLIFSDLTKISKEDFLKKHPQTPYLLENLDSILVTGKLDTNGRPEDSMLGMITGKFDNIENIISFIKEINGGQPEMLEEYESYKIYKNNEKGFFAFKPNFIIFADKLALVKTAIDISYGKQPSIAKNETAIKLLNSVKGKMISIVGSDLTSLASEVGSQAPAPFNELQQAREVALTLDAGSTGELLLDGAITTPSAEGAKKLVDTVNAFLTIIKANPDSLNKEKPYISKVLDSIKAEADGAKLALHIILPKEMIDDLSKNLMDSILKNKSDDGTFDAQPDSSVPTPSQDRAPVAPE